MVAVVITFINAIFFLITGVEDAIHGYQEVFKAEEHGRPGIHFVESLDAFMVSLVFLIFSLGIMRIFTHYHTEDNKLPAWLRINSFTELKVLLWETILVTLVILTVSVLITNLHALNWQLLIPPGVTLILSLSLYLMKKGGGH
jgi:uncharacterized membrane protein YqhA